MAACVWARRLAGNKARRLSMLRAQGRESALPRQPAQQVQHRDNLETIRHLQKGGGGGNLSMWATVAYLYACLFKYSHWCAENKERTDSENLVGQVASSWDGCICKVTVHSAFEWGNKQDRQGQRGKRSTWPNDTVAKSGHDGSWGEFNTE